jgi:uncharacterized protein YdeI (YjbR/CyaY-like superfamily)
MGRTNPLVDGLIATSDRWKKEFEQLRRIALACELTEEMKWGQPCYVFEKKNVVLIHGFKEYCAFLFFKGALLKDPERILVQQTENVQSARQVRFTDVREIRELEPVLKAYIQEAIEAEKTGAKVPLKKTAEFKMPEEFQKKLKSDPGLKKAFNALTPGRQRGYLLYFSAAKQARTREARIEKCTPLILEGKGLND